MFSTEAFGQKYIWDIFSLSLSRHFFFTIPFVDSSCARFNFYEIYLTSFHFPVNVY